MLPLLSSGTKPSQNPQQTCLNDSVTLTLTFHSPSYKCTSGIFPLIMGGKLCFPGRRGRIKLATKATKSSREGVEECAARGRHRFNARFLLVHFNMVETEHV